MTLEIHPYLSPSSIQICVIIYSQSEAASIYNKVSYKSVNLYYFYIKKRKIYKGRGFCIDTDGY